MTVATACRVEEKKFVGFSFEYNSRPFEGSSWTLVEEGKEFVRMYRLLLYWLSGLSSSVSSFVCKLVSCVIYILQVDQRIILKFWRVDIYGPIRFVFYYFIFEPKYFLLVHFRSYFSRMFLNMFLLLILRLEKNVYPISYMFSFQILKPSK